MAIPEQSLLHELNWLLRRRFNKNIVTYLVQGGVSKHYNSDWTFNTPEDAEKYARAYAAEWFDLRYRGTYLVEIITVKLKSD